MPKDRSRIAREKLKLATADVAGLRPERPARAGEAPQATPRIEPARQTPGQSGISFVEKRNPEAVALELQEALCLNPQSFENHLELARILMQLNRPEEAIEHHRRALELKPASLVALNDLAITLLLLKRQPDAVQYLRRIAALDPDSIAAHNTLAKTLAEAGEWSQAAASYRRVLELDETANPARTQLALCYLHLHRYFEAVEEYKRALAAEPDNAAILINLSVALSWLKRNSEAVVYLRHAIRLDPLSSPAHNSLALSLNVLGRFREAESAFERALKLDPANTQALMNLGNFHLRQERLEESLADSELGILLKPDDSWPHLNKAFALAQRGDLQEGLEEYEWRWRDPDRIMRYRHPFWDGSDLTGKTILLWSEQGLGDSIQFIRYAAQVKARGAARVVVECQAALTDLFKTCPGADIVYCEETPVEERPHFDVHAPLMSLARILGVTLATVPADVPYLTADPDRVHGWRDKLANEKGLKIGIAWQGNPQNDLQRSVPLNRLGPLAAMKDVRLFSLQRGYGSEQIGAQENDLLRSLATPVDPELPPASAMNETAAVIMNLDLVVTIDSALAHLAGALGRPVWVLLTRGCDWRWLQERSDSPWYPSMRLFRQQRHGQWEPVVKQVSRRIEAEMNRRSAPTGRGQ